MGKKQHQSDKLYLTTTEWKHFFGGHKEDPISQAQRSKFKRVPFDHCCLSLVPFETPVCTPEGHVFELTALIPFLKKFGNVSPVSGKKIDPKGLVHLNLRREEGKSDRPYICPITLKPLTASSHIVAVKTTGNVFSYDAIEMLNIKRKHWKDLLTDEPFTRADLITIQDPAHLEKFNMSTFYHIRKNMHVDDDDDDDDKTQTLRKANAETRDIMSQLERDYKTSDLTKEIARGTRVLPLEAQDSLSAAHYSTGAVAAGFTSTAMDRVTTHAHARIDESELKYARVKKKAYVRLVTNIGHLNFELHADLVPRTCENFVRHCGSGYYNNTVFHRLIKYFMVQGGDPTGTGTGGESIWGGSFKDEFRSNLTHNERGVLSMANSGTDTNKSQFFITFRSCQHLDKKHTVFGKLVGGVEVLLAMEQLETDDKDRPLKEIKVLSTQIFVDPFAEAEEQLKSEREALALEEAKLSLPPPKIGDEIKEEKGISLKSKLKEKSDKDTPVGKFVKTRTRAGVRTASSEAAVVPAKKKKTGTFDFSRW